MIIERPASCEYSIHYKNYIGLVTGNDLLEALNKSKGEIIKFISGLPGQKAEYRYAPGKWSIKEVLTHITDTERIFAYRALRFARNDKTALPGYDEEKYTPESNAANRTLVSILDEFVKVRESTIALFDSFSPGMVMRSGTANNNEITVRALGYIISGHAMHHINVIKERYL